MSSWGHDKNNRFREYNIIHLRIIYSCHVGLPNEINDNIGFGKHSLFRDNWQGKNYTARETISTNPFEDLVLSAIIMQNLPRYHPVYTLH